MPCRLFQAGAARLEPLFQPRFDHAIDEARFGPLGIAQVARLVQALAIDADLFKRKTVFVGNGFRPPAARKLALSLRRIHRVRHGDIADALDLQGLGLHAPRLVDQLAAGLDLLRIAARRLGLFIDAGGQQQRRFHIAGIQQRPRPLDAGDQLRRPDDRGERGFHHHPPLSASSISAQTSRSLMSSSLAIVSVDRCCTRKSSITRAMRACLTSSVERMVSASARIPSSVPLADDAQRGRGPALGLDGRKRRA